MNVPHPIPYQGSKRNLAGTILRYFPAKVERLHEPFAGSAAISLAAAMHKRSQAFHINDLNKPLVDLWRAIVNSPERLSKEYETLWNEQLPDPRAYYKKIRDAFNLTGRPDCFLYLLARCVKASVRYNATGEFNQSPDNRRRGATPGTMRQQIFGASFLLKGRTTFSSRNYRDVLMQATEADLVYMDPPYQGVCGNRDSRYLGSVQFCEFVEALEKLNHRGLRYIVSYDGRTGSTIHGRNLPEHLNLTRIEIEAGRSSQATLLGRDDATVECLYLSPSLAEEMMMSCRFAAQPIRRSRGHDIPAPIGLSLGTQMSLQQAERQRRAGAHPASPRWATIALSAAEMGAPNVIATSGATATRRSNILACSVRSVKACRT